MSLGQRVRSIRPPLKRGGRRKSKARRLLLRYRVVEKEVHGQLVPVKVYEPPPGPEGMAELDRVPRRPRPLLRGTWPG